MTSKENEQELAELITATREHFSYIQELGVEHIEIAVALPDHTPSSLAPDPRTDRIAAKPPISSANKTSLPPRSKPVPRETLFEDLAPTEPTLAASTETFEEIWDSIGNCTRCPLFKGRTNIVHTEGNRQARLMFVGEAPGADEDIQARPFVGRAGQLLTKIIEAIGFKREEVLIGNINRCRPPGNRPPTAEEVEMCKPFLLREIATVQPEVIVVLGNTAMRNLLNTKEPISKLRGKFQDYRGIKVMPTFHPAYLLRDPSKKRETWDDLKKVRDYLDAKS
jgi:uracil-DNA glycosylase